MASTNGIFRDKVVWVTGAGTGIGRATALMFAAGEARVALFGRRREALEAVLAEAGGLEGGGPDSRCIAEPVDVSDRAALDAATGRVLERLGRVDFLINNAGGNARERSLRQLKPEDWDTIIAVNLTGAYNVVRATLPAMRAQGGGLIVNVSSLAGVKPSALAGAAYSASKHGMNALSGVINEEEWPQGIRATALCPGEVNTPILEKRPVPVPPEKRMRMIQPEDVAATIRFLAELHPRSHVPEMVLMPVHRRQRASGEPGG